MTRLVSTSSLKLAFAAAVIAAGFVDASEAARLAMVVGNDNYQSVTRLRNSRNDAQAVAAELQRAGFAVTTVLDGTRQAMNHALDGFLARVEKGDEVVFYFSGHGSQPPSAGPYLLPVDIQVSNERSIMRDGMSLEQLVTDLNQRARFSLLIIDACRDDPFRQTSAGRSLPPGSALARLEPPRGSMIIMAASKGQQALDRLSDRDPVPNGLFTRELLKHMRTPGLSAGEMLKRVRGSVERTAASVNHQQRPSLVDEASSDFFFYPGTAVTQSPMPAPAPLSAPAPAPAQPAAALPASPGSGARLAPLPGPSTPLLVRPPPSSSAAAAIGDFKDWQLASKLQTTAGYVAYLHARPNGRWAQAARLWADLTSPERQGDPQVKALRTAAAQPGASLLHSGAVYRPLVNGEGPSPQLRDSVLARWRGTRIDGKEFDRSSNPQELPLSGVINCWQEALLIMRPGGKAQVTCPAATAYGSKGDPSTLVFDIELLRVVKR